MDVVAEAVQAVCETGRDVPGLRFTFEPEYLRFFQAKFEPVAAPVRKTAARSAETVVR